MTTRARATAAKSKARRKPREPTSIRLTRDQVEQIASEAADRALSQLFLTLGIDTSSPEGILNAQRDFQHVRAWRTSIETVKRQGIMSAIGVITVGILALIWARVGGTHTAP